MEDEFFRERRSVHVQSNPVTLGQLRKLFLEVREQSSLPDHVAQNDSVVGEFLSGIEGPYCQVSTQGGGDWVGQEGVDR
ncbi:hypothetical protein D3C76_1667230 [compost metagenome]